MLFYVSFSKEPAFFTVLLFNWIHIVCDISKKYRARVCKINRSVIFFLKQILMIFVLSNLTVTYCTNYLFYWWKVIFSFMHWCKKLRLIVKKRGQNSSSTTISPLEVNSLMDVEHSSVGTYCLSLVVTTAASMCWYIFSPLLRVCSNTCTHTYTHTHTHIHTPPPMHTSPCRLAGANTHWAVCCGYQCKHTHTCTHTHTHIESLTLWLPSAGVPDINYL